MNISNPLTAVTQGFASCLRGSRGLALLAAITLFGGVACGGAADPESAEPQPDQREDGAVATCPLASRSVVPAIGSKAAWDAKFDAQYGASVPDLAGNADTYAWQGHYWVRAYVSMAKTYGDTKYLDRAVTTIDFWFAHKDAAGGGWGASLGPAQQMLDTGVIAQAITIFSYAVWNDSRFAAYRPKASSYVTSLEPMLHTYDAQWVEGAPYPGSPSFYRYATCGGLCSPASLVMYNQGATMAKALLMIDRMQRLQGQTPDAGYLHKADASAAYFKTFATLNGSAYSWSYGGARTSSGIEDASHAHLDLSLLVSAYAFGLGGLTTTDMTRLAGTMQKVLNGAAGPNDVSFNVDGTGLPSSDWDRVPMGYDWIDLADFDPTLYDKTVNVFNAHMANPTSARFYLGWAEILRKQSCVSLTSAAPPPPVAITLTNGVALTNLSGAAGAQTMYQITVPSGATNLKLASWGGTGDFDLYAKFGALPTINANDVSSHGPTTSDTITIAAPQAGTYYLLGVDNLACSGVSLLATYD